VLILLGGDPLAGPQPLPVLLERDRREEPRVRQHRREAGGVIDHTLVASAGPGVFEIHADEFAQHREVQRVRPRRQVPREVGVGVVLHGQLERLDPVGEFGRERLCGGGE
jgi:hypothetical protein